MEIIKTYHGRGKHNKHVSIYIAVGRTWAEDRIANVLASKDNDLTMTSTENEVVEAYNDLKNGSMELSTFRLSSTSNSPARQAAFEAMEPTPSEFKSTAIEDGMKKYGIPPSTDTVKNDPTHNSSALLVRKVHASHINSGQVLDKQSLSHLYGLFIAVMELVDGERLIDQVELGGLMVIADIATTTTNDTVGTSQHIRGLALITLSTGEAWVLDKAPLTHIPWGYENAGEPSPTHPTRVCEFLNNWLNANGVNPPGKDFGYKGF